ncbi:hypothetical protein JTE90_021472 [Oedothorax gibbosus]|uniref:Transmembrane protein n=1 Tax=Oedothorax gibbosus TaxID=931172 RepID=A0AAV6VX52_9ARAC|nr:hypothetical protein JTE90_021472 [Oedothorax gibbosus]
MIVQKIKQTPKIQTLTVYFFLYPLYSITTSRNSAHFPPPQQVKPAECSGHSFMTNKKKKIRDCISRRRMEMEKKSFLTMIRLGMEILFLSLLRGREMTTDVSIGYHSVKPSAYPWKCDIGPSVVV